MLRFFLPWAAAIHHQIATYVVKTKDRISGGRALGPPLCSGGPKPSSDPKWVFRAGQNVLLAVHPGVADAPGL